MTTRARRVGGEWELTGEKMWITSGSIADVAVIWAVEEGVGSRVSGIGSGVSGGGKDDAGRVRGFLVETDRAGFKATDIKGKWSLRASVTSGLRLEGVRVPEENLLPGTAGGKTAGLKLSLIHI